MKALFAHSNKFIYNSGKYYSEGSFNIRVLSRYTAIFNNLIVLSRQVKSEQLEDNYTLSSGENMKFVKVPDMSSIKNIKEFPERLKVIEKEIKKSDYVIARLPSGIGAQAVKYAKKHNKPYLIELVGCPWDALWNHSIKGKILAPYRYLQTKKNVRDAPYVLYVTNNFLQKRYPTKGNSVGLSDVTLKESSDKILTNRLEKIKNKKEGKIIMGTVGAINVKYKGQQHVIQAIGELKAKGKSNIEYQLVGSGDSKYLQSVAKKYGVSDQVVFLGSKPHEDVFEWLDTVDIYIQPSLTEGLPRALIEAMSRACPVIGSNVGGIPELISNSFMFETKNTKELLEKINEMDKVNMMSEAKNNFEMAKKFSDKLLTKKRYEFYKEFKEWGKR